jgi:hypothetical protein
MKRGLALSTAFVLAGELIACQAGGALADSAQDVALRAETPVVAVPPRRSGRQFLDLPALEYTFEIETRCDDDWVPESLSLNVADSRIAFGAGQLSDSTPHEIVLNVPAQQLAPVAVHDFCLLPEDRAGQAAGVSPASAPLTIRAVLSAQASFLCVSEQERRITYVSQPLDVTLTCDAPVPAETGDRESR